MDGDLLGGMRLAFCVFTALAALCIHVPCLLSGEFSTDVNEKATGPPEKVNFLRKEVL